MLCFLRNMHVKLALLWLGPTSLPIHSTGHWPNVMCWILTHWGRVTHICVGNLAIIGPDNGLSPGRHRAINAWILSIGPWGTNFSEILIGIQIFWFKKMHLKMSSAEWRPFCLGLNVLTLVRQSHAREYLTDGKYKIYGHLAWSARTIIIKGALFWGGLSHWIIQVCFRYPYIYMLEIDVRYHYIYGYGTYHRDHTRIDV